MGNDSRESKSLDVSSVQPCCTHFHIARKWADALGLKCKLLFLSDSSALPFFAFSGCTGATTEMEKWTKSERKPSYESTSS